MNARGFPTLPRLGLLLAVLGLALPAVARGDPRVRPGEWSPKKIPAGWVVIDTEHYQIQSQCGEDEGRRLGEHIEACLAMYEEMLPFRKTMPRFVVKLFADRAAYLGYDAPEGSAAYYSKSAKEIVGYDTGIISGVRDIPDVALVGFDATTLDAGERTRLDALLTDVTEAYTMDAAGILAHEGWHQYFHYYTVSWVQMPSWIDEGVGDYFYTATRGADGAFVLGALNERRLRAIRYAFDDGTSVTFAELLGFAQQDYYSNPGVFYAQGWSMVHFLMHNEDPELRDLVPKYIKYFKDKKSIEKTGEKIFAEIDLEELDRAWIGWVLKLTLDDPLATLATAFGARVRPEHLEGHDELATSSLRTSYAERLERLGIERADEP